MRLPPDDGPAAKDVPDPLVRGETGNNPDNSNSLQFNKRLPTIFYGCIMFVYVQITLFSSFNMKIGVCPTFCTGNINIISHSHVILTEICNRILY
jgi:hypothetical protein